MFVNIADNIKKGVVVFIILLFIFGCMSLKTHRPILESNKIKYAKEFKEGASNFVFLVKEMQPIICLDDEECSPILGSTASGLVLSSDTNSVFVLTAAHFCIPDTENNFLFMETIIGYADDTPRELNLLHMDEEKDLCMLFGVKEENEKFMNIKITDSTLIGEEVYTVAAPDSIAGPGKRLIFTGKMAGCDESICITTLPATFGSSGAGIYNKKGELITIVMAVPQEFNYVVLSPSNEDIIKFIEDIDSVVDIYPYK